MTEEPSNESQVISFRIPKELEQVIEMWKMNAGIEYLSNPMLARYLLYFGLAIMEKWQFPHVRSQIKILKQLDKEMLPATGRPNKLAVLNRYYKVADTTPAIKGVHDA